MSQWLHQLLSMGTYAAYVWPAYGIVGCVLLLNALSVRQCVKSFHLRVQQWFDDASSS
jgi:heme exporter protein D